MDNIRILLWFALLTMIWLGFNQWVEDYGAESAPANTNPVNDIAIPESDLPPVTGVTTEFDDQLPNPGLDATPNLPTNGSAEIENPIRVRTDVFDILINPNGGDIARVDLLEYPVVKNNPDQLVRLLDFDPDSRWLIQSGVRSADSEVGPTHLATYTARTNQYTLQDGRDELIVTLDWVGEDGITAHKTYTFRRGQYAVTLDIQVQNNTATIWRAVPYTRMVRRNIVADRSFTDVDSYSYTGPVIYDGDSSDKLDFEDLQEQPLSARYTNGWLASIQHHFLSAIVPSPEIPFAYQANATGDSYTLTAIGDIAPISAGGASNYSTTLFIGPKLQDQLAATADELDLTVDYGMFTPLSKPLFWLLDKAHGYLHNWGLAIIAVTFLIKLVFYRLTAASGRSMAKMRKIAPRMKALQERFKDDRQALSQAMMDLYKKEKVNPAAGCLPILIQMPFFLAFYWALIENVEMRQAPFMLWIDDISVRDPYFVLPFLMGAAMFFQTKLNPAPPDPIQARVMQIMPLIFCVMFAFFPAGLVLYWLTNTVLGIAQQWRINKVVEAET